MNFEDYSKLALRTAAQPKLPESLIVAGLGCAGEAGEFADLVKKHVFHGHALNKEKMLNELGDQLWYVNLGADALGVTLEEVARLNIEKLKKRYPEGFSQESSRNRIQ